MLFLLSNVKNVFAVQIQPPVVSRRISEGDKGNRTGIDRQVGWLVVTVQHFRISNCFPDLELDLFSPQSKSTFSWFPSVREGLKV